MNARRLLNDPIIFTNMDERLGTNINGPSVIRVPEWVENRLGTYYLYFSHHKGSYIRMAYANDVSGPWKNFSPGVLELKDSFFDIEDRPDDPNVYAHIASPDVHVDHTHQQIYMYYHGMLDNTDQQTRIAFSSDGIIFKAQEDLLGPPYFRVFQYGDYYYAITWGGKLLRSRVYTGPFESGPSLGVASMNKPNRVLRHCAILIRHNTLHLFFSCIDDCPEQILCSQINLDDDWSRWEIRNTRSVLKPEFKWEGKDYPLVNSKIGMQENVHQLRDPCIFETQGKTYLFYCGAGEKAIGVAILDLLGHRENYV